MDLIDTYVLKLGKYVIDKDPSATLDYSLDWTEYLEDLGDSIASATVVADPLLTVVNVSHDLQTVTAWISGGAGSSSTAALQVTFRITTNHTPPRVDDRSIYLKIKER